LISIHNEISPQINRELRRKKDDRREKHRKRGGRQPYPYLPARGGTAILIKKMERELVCFGDHEKGREKTLRTSSMLSEKKPTKLEEGRIAEVAFVTEREKKGEKKGRRALFFAPDAAEKREGTALTPFNKGKEAKRGDGFAAQGKVRGKEERDRNREHCKRILSRMVRKGEDR